MLGKGTAAFGDYGRFLDEYMKVTEAREYSKVSAQGAVGNNVHFLGNPCASLSEALDEPMGMEGRIGRCGEDVFHQ